MNKDPLGAMSELRVLQRQIKKLADSGGDPKLIFEVIFSDTYSKRIHTLFSHLNTSLEYYDPDTTYEEDVQAFVTAVEAKMAELEKLFNY